MLLLISGGAVFLLTRRRGVDEHTRAPLGDGIVDVAAVVRLAEQVQVAEPHVGLHAEGSAGRNDHAQAADVDARGELRLADRQANVAQVDEEVADAEPVAPVEVGGGGRHVGLVADSATQVHREDGDEDRDRDEQEREQAADDDEERAPKRPRRAGATAAGTVGASVAASPAELAAGAAGSSTPRLRVSRKTAPPLIRRSIQAASPEGQRLTRESSTAAATAAMPSAITVSGWFRRSRSAADAIESSLPSSGMTSAAAR